MFLFIISWLYKIFFILGFLLVFSKEIKFFYLGGFLIIVSFPLYFYDLKKSSEKYTYTRENICGKYLFSSTRTGGRGAGRTLDVKINTEKYGSIKFIFGTAEFEKITKRANLKDSEICVDVSIRSLNGKKDLKNITYARGLSLSKIIK